jgi:hypothetical protein
MTNTDHYAKGFQQIATKSKHLEEINNLINDNNVQLIDLEKKLTEISSLADMDRKDYTKQSIIGWVFILISIIAMYLSINISSSWYFLSIPVLIITLLFLIFILGGEDTLGASIRECFFKLIFKYDVGMLDYIEGRKSDAMKEPKYSYIYMEKRLLIKKNEI